MKKLQLKVWRDIVRQRWQFLALVLIILLGVASYGSMMGMISDVIQSIERTLEELRFQDFVVTFDGPVPENVVEKIAGLDNVQAVTGRLVIDTGLHVSEDNQAHARLIGMPVGVQPAVNQVYVKQGDYLQPGEGWGAVLDHHFAEAYGYEPGSVLHPIVEGRQVEIQVVGIGISPEYLMAVAAEENPMPDPSGFAVLFVPQEDLTRRFDVSGQISELNVRLADNAPENVEAAIAQVKQALSGVTIRSVTERADNPSYNLLMADLEGGQEMMSAVPSMFLTVAAMSIYVFLSRMVQAQRTQVGVAKALGYGRWALLRHYLLFSAVVAVVGSVLGFLLSYPIGLGFSKAYAAEFGLPFVVAEFHWDSAAEAILITLFFCLLAGFFPAWSSARMAPAQAIRFDPSIALVKGSVPLVERVLAPIVQLRTGTKVALRNIFRSRRRTLTTVLGFIFAFVVLLACWALFDGLGNMLAVQFEETELWDVRATFSRPQMAAVLDKVSRWPGVEVVEPVIELPVTLESATTSEEVLMVAIDPGTSLHGFRLPKGKAPVELLLPEHVLISPELAKDLGVESGDEIAAQTLLGSQQLIVEAYTQEVMNFNAYVSLSWVWEEEAGGQEFFTGLLLQVDEDHEREIRRLLYELPSVASVNLKQDIIAGWRSLMGLYYVMMGAFLLFALGIAGAVIFNTMTVNVLERQREIATMRTLGQSRRRLRNMITLENVLIGLLSLVPGLGIGYGVTYYLFQVFAETVDFYFPLHIAPTSYLIVTVLIFVTALLSQIPAVRRVNRLDLAEATKVLA
jgi:putative ABC transport system permease protein